MKKPCNQPGCTRLCQSHYNTAWAKGTLKSFPIQRAKERLRAAPVAVAKAQPRRDPNNDPTEIRTRLSAIASYLFLMGYDEAAVGVRAAVQKL